jgi:hypothetical protein
MATLYISEFENCIIDARGNPVAAPEYPTAVPDHTVAITGSSAQSTPFSGKTRFIQYSVDAICSIAIDANASATTTNARVAANETRFVGVKRGHVIAVIANT